MELADLIDLEWLLRDGAELPADVIEAARPAAQQACARRGLDPPAARGRLDLDRNLRVALVRAFLDAARKRVDGLPGHRTMIAIRVIGGVLAGLGILLGYSTAQFVLAYDGSTPINVLHFATVFFALQLVLLAFMVVFLLRRKRSTAHEGPPLFHRPVAWLVDRALGARGRAAAEALRALRTRASLYAAVEKWTLFALAQRLGVFFNLAALVTTLALVVGTDLVFSWSTTLVDVSGEHAHRIASLIALPWSSLWPEGLPSLQIVQQSRWVRMPGAFAGNVTLVEAQQFAAQWWHFLVAGLLTYGLLPRVLALALAGLARRRTLHGIGLDHAGCHALFDRLLPTVAGWSGPDPDTLRGPAPAVVPGGEGGTPAPAEPGSSSIVVCWGSLGRIASAVGALVERRSGVRITAAVVAGSASIDDDDRALAEIRTAKVQRLLFAFAAGRQPTTDVLQFVRRAREVFGVRRPIVVWLLEPRSDGSFASADPEEHAIWRRSLGSLGDTHLWVEPAPEGS